MKLDDYYLPKKLTKYNYNVYTSRVEIVNFIQSQSNLFSGTVLDVGCGNKPYEKIICSAPSVTKYVGMDLDNSDIYNSVKKDLIWDGNKIPLDNNSIETVLATELLEHCFDTKNILTEIQRVIKADGVLVGTVPFIWPLHETPNDYYRFTPFALQKHLENCGFKEVKIVALGGNNKMLSVALAIWLINHPGGRFKKKILRTFILPIMKRLNKKDKPGKDLLQENNTFIGLGFIAKK